MALSKKEAAMPEQKEKTVKDAAAYMDVRPLDDNEVDAVAGGTGTDWGDDYEGRAAAEGKTWLKGYFCGWCGKETVYGKKWDDKNHGGGVIIDEYHYCWCYACEKPHAVVLITQ